MSSEHLILLLILAFAGFPQVSSASESCAGITTEGSLEEVATACDSYLRVQAYFARLGFDRSLTLRVRFQDTVRLDGPVDGYPVTGLFVPADALIEMTSLDSAVPARALHWNQPWTRPIAASILDHEFAHAFVSAVQSNPLPQSWNEFVAYAVQFELIQPALREAILAAYPGAEPHQQRSEVCDMNYLIDFDLLGVRSYLTAEASGGPDYIKKILVGDVPAGTPRRFECP
jgi:hypothetical protein